MSLQLGQWPAWEPTTVAQKNLDLDIITSFNIYYIAHVHNKFKLVYINLKMDQIFPIECNKIRIFL
jgi:hypothetical protein